MSSSYSSKSFLCSFFYNSISTQRSPLLFLRDEFQVQCSKENGTPPYQYHRDFGDGNTSYQQNPIHAYRNDGNFTVTLSVTDSDKVTIRDSTWALISGDNNPPGAPIIKGPTSGKPGVEYDYTFNSSDDEGDELKYLIDWGDGIEEVIEVFPSGTEAPASHAWSKKGSYNIKAKAEDQWGALSDLGSLNVTLLRDREMVKSNFLKLLKNFLITNYLSERLNIILQINILFQGLKI